MGIAMSLILKHLPERVLQGLTAVYFRVSTFRKVGFRGTHTSQKTIDLDRMQVFVLPSLADNYMYLIIDQATKEAAVVDPVAPESVQRTLDIEGANLTKILTTHHHWDHAGGNVEMASMYKNKLEVYGGDRRIEGITHLVKHGDKLKVGEIDVECLFTPCHTTGHICYYFSPPPGQTPAVFTGDTLFVAGCGRFFEGTPEQMYTALVDKLGSLPDNTQVYCGHEYTVKNLLFARQIEEKNQDILDKIAYFASDEYKGGPTVPSTIGCEKKINPFMRVAEPSVQARVKCTDPISTMKVLRAMKDNF